jgi:hypothetical protein
MLIMRVDKAMLLNDELSGDDEFVESKSLATAAK